MVAEREGREFEILKDILNKSGIPDTWFFVGGYSEDAVCIEKADEGYTVYSAIRGQKKFLSVHMEVKEAVDAFLQKLVRDKAQAQEISEEFARRINE